MPNSSLLLLGAAQLQALLKGLLVEGQELGLGGELVLDGLPDDGGVDEMCIRDSCKSAVELLRAQGVKAGLIRPITVHPFPYAAYDHIDYSRVKAVLDVEMSIPAQFVDDVAVAVKDRCPIETCQMCIRDRTKAAHTLSALSHGLSPCLAAYPWL